MRQSVFILGEQTKIQLPADEKTQHLGLVQQFICFQILIQSSNILFEIALTDSAKVSYFQSLKFLQTKRRLIFHHGAKELVANPLHARVPVTQFRRNQWLNLTIDVFAFAESCFKGVNVRSIDFIKVAGACKIRRIFTTLSPLFDDELEESTELQIATDKLREMEIRSSVMFEHVPKQLDYPPTISHGNQFIFPHRIMMKTEQSQQAPIS